MEQKRFKIVMESWEDETATEDYRDWEQWFSTFHLQNIA